MYTVTGKLKMKGESRKVSDSFTVREFVLTDDSSQYPQHVQFQLCQDKTSLLNDFVEGQELTVSFNLRGREYTKDGNTRYFNTLDAWRVVKKESATATTVDNEAQVVDEDDSLPF